MSSAEDSTHLATEPHVAQDPVMQEVSYTAPSEEETNELAASAIAQVTIPPDAHVEIATTGPVAVPNGVSVEIPNPTLVMTAEQELNDDANMPPEKKIKLDQDSSVPNPHDIGVTINMTEDQAASAVNHAIHAAMDVSMVHPPVPVSYTHLTLPTILRV